MSNRKIKKQKKKLRKVLKRLIALYINESLLCNLPFNESPSGILEDDSIIKLVNNENTKH